MKKLLIILMLALPVATFGQLDTINVGTSANSGTGESLRSAMLKTNNQIKAWNAIQMYNISLAEMSVLDGATGTAEGVTRVEWNSGIEDNYIKALQAAGMSIMAGPSTGFYPRVSHTIYDGTAIWTQFYLFDTLIITGVGFLQDTQGAYTADNYNGFAIYSVSGTTYTKIDSTANDGNLWKAAANTSATKAFVAGPHTLNPGLYYVFLVYNSSAQTTAPKIYFNNDFLNAAFSGLTGTNKIAGTVASQTTPPMTETGGDVTASNEIPTIWLY